MAKRCKREICYFPHPFSSKQHQNLFTSEILLLAVLTTVKLDYHEQLGTDLICYGHLRLSFFARYNRVHYNLVSYNLVSYN